MTASVIGGPLLGSSASASCPKFVTLGYHVADKTSPSSLVIEEPRRQIPIE